MPEIINSMGSLIVIIILMYRAQYFVVDKVVIIVQSLLQSVIRSRFLFEIVMYVKPAILFGSAQC